LKRMSRIAVSGGNILSPSGHNQHGADWLEAMHEPPRHLLTAITTTADGSWTNLAFVRLVQLGTGTTTKEASGLRDPTGMGPTIQACYGYGGPALNQLMIMVYAFSSPSSLSPPFMILGVGEKGPSKASCLARQDGRDSE
jgi:hypothetical protein